MTELSRRNMLRATAAAGSAGLVSWFGERPAVAATAQSLLPPPVSKNFTWLTQAEIIFLDAALARLIPADALGPGAKEAGVTFFIDQQMAGAYGRAERWYMQGPWKPGTDEQGYQLKLTPAQLYRTTIQAIDDYCRRSFDKKTFAQLAFSDQDKVLHGLEKGDIELPDAAGTEFFTMLWQNTQEGFFADPLYGGNRNFAGWKLVGFPGPRYNYVNEIEQYGKVYEHPTVGLTGRAGVPVRAGEAS